MPTRSAGSASSATGCSARTIDFPATVPTGTYFIEVLLVRDGSVVSGQTTPLVVSQIGLDAEVGEFAERRALIYGLIAVAIGARWQDGWPACRSAAHEPRRRR